MHAKLAMTCFKYQVYLYGSEAITYLNAFLWVVKEPAILVISFPFVTCTERAVKNSVKSQQTLRRAEVYIL